MVNEVHSHGDLQPPFPRYWQKLKTRQLSKASYAYVAILSRVGEFHNSRVIIAFVQVDQSIWSMRSTVMVTSNHHFLGIGKNYKQDSSARRHMLMLLF